MYVLAGKKGSPEYKLQCTEEPVITQNLDFYRLEWQF